MTRKSTGTSIIARQRPNSILLARARQLRREATSVERKAWELLRGRRLLGLKFRRQQVIGSFIVDFYCARLRLAIELDGPIHGEEGRPIRDAERDAQITSRGARVLRLRNEEVTAERLIHLLAPFLGPPPLPEGEGAGG